MQVECARWSGVGAAEPRDGYGTRRALGGVARALYGLSSKHSYVGPHACINLDVHVAGDVVEHEFEVRGVSEARDDRFVSTCHGYEHNIRWCALEF